jgi:putative isomerase
MSSTTRKVFLAALVALAGPAAVCWSAEGNVATRPACDLSRLIKQLHINDPDRNPYLPLGEWLAEGPEPPAGLSPERREAFYRAWTTLWINTQPAEGAWIRPIISPGAHYMRGIWLWDAAFHILGLAHGGPKARKLGLWQVEVMLSGQQESGKIAREIWKTGPRSFGRHGIQAPGIMTLAANRLLASAQPGEERTAVLGAMEKFYPQLASNHRWFWANTRTGSGLCTWTTVDSWDTSPRWDEKVSAALDLNCWLFLDRIELAAMAESIGKADEASEWRREAEELRKAINDVHFSSKQGLFNDVLEDQSLSTCLTPVIFWPMWTGVAREDQIEAAIASLKDPKVFGSKWPIPSVATSHPAFRARDYWRGPVWINLNWMTIRGLQRYGRREAADALREKTLDLVARTAILHEYYDPTDGSGLGSPHYGWTAALYIDLIMNP